MLRKNGFVGGITSAMNQSVIGSGLQRQAPRLKYRGPSKCCISRYRTRGSVEIVRAVAQQREERAAATEPMQIAKALNSTRENATTE